MARKDSLGSGDKARLLRALAFHIRRKRPVEEAFTEVMEQEFRGGRHRLFRPVADAMAETGILSAFILLGLMGIEAGAVMAAVLEANDHRLLAGALERLADHAEQFPD
ncbi:hypothetical protein [Magnetospirillum sp. SS-4]|uniref:hypothetical protein n=1 Tax=Magnetospirillum sp. SS-4 TaxID=2681465 RepID=UPI0013805015|nr:hypothetical protein [Magnetospirillum sp. SS-4]CAA7624467.1 conserved hypothetical protein [Magnetospirillum sp. SS-4]